MINQYMSCNWPCLAQSYTCIVLDIMLQFINLGTQYFHVRVKHFMYYYQLM